MRKELKKQARQHLKKHYWLFVVICLITGVLGLEYSGGLSSLRTDANSESSEYDTVYTRILEGKIEQGEELSNRQKAMLESQESKIGRIALGHSRGVLADVFNNVSSGTYLIKFANMIRSMGMSKNGMIIFFIAMALLVQLFFQICVFNPFGVVYKRIFMEARTYDFVPIKRFLFLLQTGRFWNVVKTIFLKSFYLLLWSLTIVGAVIKSFSYMLVPYIMAENPDIQPKEAITLSRKMMDGHKWEAFKLELSFIGWYLLGYATIGLVDILYTHPYLAATKVEYYVYLRQLALHNQIEGAGQLNDIYLYENASKELLEKTYSDILPVLEEPIPEIKKHTGFRGFLENVLGLTLTYDQDERDYQMAKAKDFQTKGFRAILAQKMYPRRLYPLKDTEKMKNIRSLHYDRHYAISSVIMIFFILSGIGWLWEVSLHLLNEGDFCNRGIMHGPWLPVYGSGCVLILVCLNKLRKHPSVQFLSAVILCGIVEYGSGWYLEVTHNGEKWWDYSGYLLNIDGRVCAEGLLVFGLGGIALVYFLAPAIDNQFRRVKTKVLGVVCSFLLAVFLGDLIYSHYYPNKGEGVTSGPSGIESTDSDMSRLDNDEVNPGIVMNDNGVIVRHLTGESVEIHV